MTNQDVINFLNQVRKMLLDDKSWLESIIQPINEAFDKSISALQAQDLQPTCNKLATDTISRQAAIDDIKECAEAAHDNHEWDMEQGYLNAIECIEELPSAHPERKVGHWLIREGISDAQCSECKMYFKDVYDMDNSDAFCRHCGTKMEELKVVKDECFNQQTGGD